MPEPVKPDPPSGDDPIKKDPSADPVAGDDDPKELTPEQMKAALAEARREAGGYRRKLRDTETQLEEKTRESQTEHEKAIADAVKARETELTASHRQEIVSLKIEARAGAQLNDAADGPRYLETRLAEFQDLKGEALTKAIDKALEELVAERPYLAKKEEPKKDGLRLATKGTRTPPADGKDSDPDAWLRKAARGKR